MFLPPVVADTFWLPCIPAHRTGVAGHEDRQVTVAVSQTQGGEVRSHDPCLLLPFPLVRYPNPTGDSQAMERLLLIPLPVWSGLT